MGCLTEYDMETVRIVGENVKVYGDPFLAQGTIERIKKEFGGTALYHRGEPHNDGLGIMQRRNLMKEIFEC